MITEIFNEYEIIIGKNAQENFDIIDTSDENDIWFHLDDHSSPHVIIRTNGLGMKIDKKIIKRACVLCKQHSKLKSEKKVAVIYTLIKYVKKDEKIVGTVHTTNVKTITI